MEGGGARQRGVSYHLVKTCAALTMVSNAEPPRSSCCWPKHRPKAVVSMEAEVLPETL